jgi:hypothetical protein
MRIDRIAQAIGGELLGGALDHPVEISRVYAGDRMSDLLNEVADGTLLVTHLAHPALMRSMDLLEAAAVCFVNGAAPEADVASASNAHRIVMLASPHGMYETCGMLYRLLNEPGTAH